jgi:hypothetical protein
VAVTGNSGALLHRNVCSSHTLASHFKNKTMNEEVKEGTTTIEAQPWGVQFTWKDKSVKITLKNGEDLIKVAEMISGLLTASGIENTLEDLSH